VSHFARFTMAHLCPLGPRVCMNCSKLSALTTRGDAVGSPLTYYFFSRLVYRGATTPYLHLDLDLGGVTFHGGGVSKPPSIGCGCVASKGGRFI
jgi:hypothetical protein